MRTRATATTKATQKHKTYIEVPILIPQSSPVTQEPRGAEGQQVVSPKT